MATKFSDLKSEIRSMKNCLENIEYLLDKPNIEKHGLAKYAEYNFDLLKLELQKLED